MRLVLALDENAEGQEREPEKSVHSFLSICELRFSPYAADEGLVKGKMAVRSGSAGEGALPAACR